MISWSPESRSIQVLRSQTAFRAVPVALEMHGVYGLGTWASLMDGRSHSSLEFLLAASLNIGLKGTSLGCFCTHRPSVQLSNSDQCFILASGGNN